MSEGKVTPPTDNREAESADVLGPQYMGIMHDTDRQKALTDPESLIVEGFNGEPVAVLTPVNNNSEVNQKFFENDNAYYFDWHAAAGIGADEALQRKISELPEGTKICLDYAVGDSPSPVDYLTGLTETTDSRLEPDQRAIDTQNGTIAGVHHYYSDINREEAHIVTPATTMREAQQLLVGSGEWQHVEESGIFYAYGPELDETTLQELWDVYNDTFDLLVESHPSAQKQLQEDFLAQCMLPESHITYARDEEGIVSALFVLDDVRQCNWLNPDFYSQLNPRGKTLFVPCISTKLNKTGLSYSPRIIDAMAKVVVNAGDVTGFATQCTNRSADYIPRIAEDSTKGSCNLAFQKTASYEYPVLSVAKR